MIQSIPAVQGRPNENIQIVLGLVLSYVFAELAGAQTVLPVVHLLLPHGHDAAVLQTHVVETFQSDLPPQGVLINSTSPRFCSKASEPA